MQVAVKNDSLMQGTCTPRSMLLLELINHVTYCRKVVFYFRLPASSRRINEFNYSVFISVSYIATRAI